MNDVHDLPRIHQLSTSLANQIAAGEVIERPVSVVKELLENAIDAGADKVQIDLLRAGVSQIVVTDNGHGIHADDLSLALTSHSTSKLNDISDLLSINTLGFRGEALASIASISRFRIQSCQDTNKQGVALLAVPKQPHSIEPVAQNKGTRVEVNELFFNVPARRKFLRSENTEYLHILALVKAIALSQFQCAFRMQHNNRQVLNVAKADADYSRRVANICGQSFVDKAYTFDFNHQDMRFWGWLGDADIARNHTDKQYLYVNGRIIRDKHINHAIRLAYQDLLYPGRHPCYVLFLEMDPELVDINVHPTKQEVRFHKTNDVHDFIQTCLYKVLHQELELSIDTRTTPNPNTIREESADHSPGQTLDQSVQNRLKKHAVDRYRSVSPISPQIIENRYLLAPAETGTLLIDIEATYKMMCAEQLIEQIENDRLKKRPLLIPEQYQANEASIDKLELLHELFSNIGIIIQRTGPDTVLVKEMPECICSLNVTAFFQEIIQATSKNSEPLMQRDSLINILISQIQWNENDVLNTEQRAQLIDFCTQQIKQQNQLVRVKSWKLLTLSDFKKILEQN